MKITGQNVPPELAALYTQHVTLASATQGPNGVVRAATATGKPTRRRKKRGAATDIERIVAMLADAYRRDSNSATDVAWRAARTAELKAGTYNPDYWIPAALIASQRLTVTGSPAELLPRPPYNYATQGNRPTTTTWGQPAPSTGAIGYAGTLTGQLYGDTSWTYQVAEYQIPPRSAAAGETMAVAVIDGTITAASNQRGSRAMFSLLARFEQLNAAADTLDAAPPPLNPATSHYWPFAPPVTPPPFYTATLRRIVAQLPTRTNQTATGQIVRLTHSVRPMMGRANNNNTTVTTQFDGTARVYVIPAARAATGYLTLAQIDAYEAGIYKFSPTTGALQFWRAMYDLPLPLREVPAGFIEAATDGHYHLRDKRLRHIAQFEDAPGPGGINIAPGVGPGIYLGYAFDATTNPQRYYRARWTLDGALIAVDYRDTPWDTRARNWYVNIPPSFHAGNIQSGAQHGYTFQNDEGTFVIRNRQWQIAAIVAIDAELYVQFDLLLYGDSTIWIGLRDSDDIDTYYCLDITSIAEPPSDQPQNLTPEPLYQTDDVNANAAVLGNTLYVQGEWSPPFALSPTGAQLPIEPIPDGYYITTPPYYETIA